MDEHKDIVNQIFKSVHRGFRIHSIVSVLMFGFVSVMIIGTMFLGFSKVQSSRKEFDIHAFNSYYEMYSGTTHAFHIESLLDEVITNNKTNKKQLIVVKYRQYLTSEPREITEIKHSLNDNLEYEVILDYDKDGYVKRILIENIRGQ